MVRWRSSLAWIGSFEITSKSISSVSLQNRSSYNSAAVPDFLAPSFHQLPFAARRYNASIRRPASQSFASNAPECSSQTSKASQRTRTSVHRRRSSVNFTSFHAKIPRQASFGQPSSSSSSIDQGIAYINSQLRAARTEQRLVSTAKALRDTDIIVEERKRVRQSHRRSLSHKYQPTPTLDLNEHFLLSLLDASFSVTRRTGKNDIISMDSLVSQTLYHVFRSVPRHGFSVRVLDCLATSAGNHLAKATLRQLLHIVQCRLAHKSADELDSTAQKTQNSSEISDNEVTLATSRVVFHLMKGFSHCGLFKRVQECFDLLDQHSLPATIFHYQLQLIALLHERSSQFTDGNQIDIERQSQHIQSDILTLKATMEANNIALDDEFLATVVHGLCAPLRRASLIHTSTAHASSLLRMSRTIYSHFIGASQSDSSPSMPRFLSALIHAEIDAIELDARPRSKIPAPTLSRVRNLIHQLESVPKADKNPLVGTLYDKPITECKMASISLRLRLSAALADIDQGLKQLCLLLHIQSIIDTESAEQQRELILRQRSGVIFLLSAAMQQRHIIKGRDAAFEVLHRGLSKEWFGRVWTGVCFPPNPSSDFDPKAHDPDVILVRLWKRWIHAWSSDYLSQGGWTRQQGTAKTDVAYRTFTGTYPWQTLRRGLSLLNHTFDQYEMTYRATPMVSSRKDGANSAISPRRKEGAEGDDDPITSLTRIHRFAALFNESKVLDKLSRVTLRGGRPGRGETMATNVNRRLSLLVRTLTRVNVSARVWERLEGFILKHLALIDREVLPTEAVKEAMDEIESRKRQALLRNRELMQALQLQRSISETDQEVQAQEFDRETGSIFVLRRMLENRARMREQHQHQQQHQQQLSAQTSSIFT
ncbi:uncharacterized protein MEPE_05828 [Melanopsichium pennsylvanicum]|uniref:Uncharacterized protein n=2 Tax=Melanopsichium pennsylvanicum TaxID=63383 RepID=A0AAJ5C817_9BASI|nr:putative protein [Melanopsichium pennsylvanicum 4]SNX87118.1 uncharacterized protein MEPE_05828 [Melanopsichium pennsylvanicum]